MQMKYVETMSINEVTLTNNDPVTMVTMTNTGQTDGLERWEQRLVPLHVKYRQAITDSSISKCNKEKKGSILIINCSR